METKIAFGLLILSGIFAMYCAVMDFDWFMEHRKAQFFLKIFGRKGTRIFYAILGAVIIVCAVLGFMNGLI